MYLGIHGVMLYLQNLQSMGVLGDVLVSRVGSQRLSSYYKLYIQLHTLGYTLGSLRTGNLQNCEAVAI